jgi:hypothetical protein
MASRDVATGAQALASTQFPAEEHPAFADGRLGLRSHPGYRISRVLSPRQENAERGLDRPKKA